MAKQLNVNLAFTADTGKAKAQLQDLQKQLTNLTVPKNVNADLPITPAVQKAAESAALLKAQLEQATNVKTGKLDLGKFSQSLDKSNMSLEKYRKSLEQLGPDGAKAFMSLATSIGNAEVPLRRTNALLSEMWVSLKNTARWQISSSLLHGFMGTVQSAYGYAQDLNESLNNIRIVTGQNTDQMAKFAKEANRAAKALSTTTTEYTNASLIYYQQGLSEAEVKERTDITIKMANVARENAETVSDQLTAVWNNFAENGTQSLEHYADAMTALGAKTASSTDEIAGGLEKFASIADMIGLSFDNAAAALATITATTRQSEDVVGTALKTIFARIQGLNLGETLDDGTTLNKYSEALSKVGISIYDSAGGLKDMDNILAEMGAKWETLSDTQQVALAQTVAGVRQYNQLVSLMDNFDTYQENIRTAQTADGTLDKQAEIYAESWEAAQDRVTAAAEKIYSALLNDDFFIDLLDGFSGVLESIGGMVDGLGGVKGVLLAISAIATKVFGAQMAKGLNDMAYNMQMLTEKGRQKVRGRQDQAWEEVGKLSASSGTEEGIAQSVSYKQTATLQRELLANAKNMTEEELKQNQIMLDGQKILQERVVEAAKEVDKVAQVTSERSKQARAESKRNGVSSSDYADAFKGLKKSADDYSKQQKTLDQFKLAVKEANGDITKLKAKIEEIKKAKGFEGASKDLDHLIDRVEQGRIRTDQLDDAIDKVGISQDDAWVENVDNFANKTKVATGTADQLGQTLLDNTATTERYNVATENAVTGVDNLKKKFQQAGVSASSFARSAVATAQMMSTVGMAMSALTGAYQTLSDPDTSGLEKLGAVLTTIGMVLPMVTTAFNMQNLAQMTTMSSAIKAILPINAMTVAWTADGVATNAATGATIGFGTALWTTLWPIGLVAAAIAALIALVVKLVKLFKENSAAGQLEALEERAEKSAEAFNNVTNAVNETKSAIEQLENSKATIAGLTQGTNEWFEAVSQTNAEIFKLIEKFPELADAQNGYIAMNNGSMALTSAGKKYLENENRNLLEGAQAVKTRDQIAVTEKEIENSYNNFKRADGKQAYSSEQAKAIQATYGNIGELLFTKEGSAELFKSFQDAGIYAGGGAYDEDSFYEFVMANADTIRQNDSKQKSIQLMQDTQLSSRAAALGSNRTADEIRDIVGQDTYDKSFANSKEDVVKGFSGTISGGTDYKFWTNSGWNNHIDYKEGDSEWSMIEDFMKLQGDNVEYSGQKNGKMVLEIDGETKEFSKDEVYDSLAALYSGAEIEKTITEGLRTSLAHSLDASTRDLETEDLVALDNFKKKLEEGLASSDVDPFITDGFFKQIVDQYGMSAEGLEAFTQDTQYIDAISEAFLKQAEALAKGTIDATQFKNALAELNAQGQMDQMGSFFTDAANNMGLGEEAAQEMHDYAKSLMEVADESDLIDDSLSSNAEAAAEVSTSVTRMNKGIDTLADNFSDWNSVLKKSDKSSAEYSKAMKGMKGALSDVLDVEEDLISSDFVEEHLEKIEKAASGDAEAIDALKAALAEDILLNVVGVSKFEELNKDIQDLHNDIVGFDADVQVGATLDTGKFLDAANQLVTDAGMTVDQAQAYFNSLGYEPEFVTEEQTVKRSIPQEQTHTDYKITAGTIDILGAKLPIPTIDRITTTRTTGYAELDETIQVPALSADGTPQIKKLTKTSSGGMNNYSSNNKGGGSPGSGSGGGGNKGSKPKAVNKSDIVERYKEITDTLDDVKDAYDDAGKASDRLYGANKIAAMKKQNAILLQEIDLLEEKKKQALDFLEIDKQALEDAAKKAGVGVLFDDNGNISNYTAIMETLFNQLKAATDAAGAEIDDAEQEAIDAIQQKIDDLKSAIAQYDDTQATIQEIDNSLEDTFDNWQQGNYDIIDYEMSLREDLLDREEKIIETQIKILGDSFYKMFEVASQYMQKLPIFEDGFANSKITLSDAENAYSNNEINQDQYISLLQSTQDSIQNNIDSMLELDEIMKNYYSETLEAGQDELDKYTDQLEHMGEVLDHYRTLLDLTGRSKDYKTIGAILESSLNNSKNLYEIAKANYEDLDARTQRIKKQLEDDSLGEKEREMLEGELATLTTLTAEAQSEMYSHLEAIGEMAAEIFANTMAQVRKDFEASLSDSWKSFEELNTQIDRLTTSQEEYLTRTNQLYETNKLIRQATLDMNKIENSQAKEKYKDYIKYIEQLQNEEELSKAELEIAQAKYDLLQAEIALQDAQNAKSQVRMTQDSEGNWGYVYTADQNKIAEAQQQYADAQNNLYNISLEGVKEYQSKISSAMQAAYDEQEAITQAWQSGEIESWDEYQRRLEESRTYWYSYMEDLYEEYGVYENSMLESSAEGYLDYTTANIGSIESFKKAYSDSMAAQTAAATTWKEDTDIITDEVGEDYTETKEKVDEVTKASDDLTKTIKETVCQLFGKNATQLRN